MGKIRVEKNDISRILLTELLPYEVPIIFSNEGFYRFFKNHKKTSCPSFIDAVFNHKSRNKNNRWIMPFNYKIRYGNNKRRTVSIMHPAIQTKFIDFYSCYDSLLLHLCSRSPISLRYPSRVASYFYYKENRPKKGEVGMPEVEEPGALENETIYARSYFVYKKYDMLHKFYDSYEFLRLEKKFKHLIRFDISKCFNSIYTHSIAWAVKDKEYSKANISDKSFEGVFDILMQDANYSETNGILIGPEVSRIFAEIILQKIDIDVLAKLEGNGCKMGSQFVIRRYGDDYFVFTNDDKLGNNILETYQTELEFFKLHLNESKKEKLDIPFITGITIARVKLQKLINEFFSKAYFISKMNQLNDEKGSIGEAKLSQEIQFSRIWRPQEIANRTIRDIKCIVKSEKVDYSSVTSITFYSLKESLEEIYRNTDIKILDLEQKKNLSNLLLAIFDIIFFLYSMDYRTAATHKVAQIIILTKRFLDKADEETKHTILKKIYDEATYVIKNVSQEENGIAVELLNLFIALKDLGDDYLLEADLLLNLLDSNKTEKNNLSYFHLTVLFYYIADQKQYKEVKQILEQMTIKLFKSKPYPLNRAEYTLLYFDIIRCPYLPDLFKNNVIEIVYSKTIGKKPTAQVRNEIRNYIKSYEWFINWSADVELEAILLKKEVSSPY